MCKNSECSVYLLFMMLVFLIGFFFIGQLTTISCFNTIYKTVGMECLPNTEYIRNVSCKLKPISWQKAVSNMVCDIAKPIRNASLHLQVFSKNYANQYQPFLVNVTQNICDILDKRIFPAYTTIVISILKQVSNVNHSCPYTGQLVAKNLFVDDKYLPISFPLGFYKVVLHFMEGHPYEDIGTVVLYVEAVEKNLRPIVRRAKNPITNLG